MGVMLEIKGGPMAGKVIALKTGESVTIGRSEAKAQFALGHDTFMSGLHFAIECGASGCRVVDRKSSNGTLLNGAKIREATLANGDEIRVGQTTFAVKMVGDGKIADLRPKQSPAADAKAPQRDAGTPARLDKGAGEPHEARLDAEAGGAVRRAGSKREKPTKLGVPAADEEPSAGERQRVDGAANVAEKNAVARNEESASRAGHDAAPPVPQRRRSADVDVRLVADLGSESQAEKPGDAQAIGARRAGGRGISFRVAGWSFAAVPTGWEVQEGFGLQRGGNGEFPASMAAAQEALGGITLQQFVESQISTLRAYLRDARMEPLVPPQVGAADETMAVDVRHKTKDGRELMYRQIYARSGQAVGILTVTALASEMGQVLESLRAVLDSVEFCHQ
jgi:hypothetical protein